MGGSVCRNPTTTRWRPSNWGVALHWWCPVGKNRDIEKLACVAVEGQDVAGGAGGGHQCAGVLAAALATAQLPDSLFALHWNLCCFE
jgi:hypothetical protein